MCIRDRVGTDVVCGMINCTDGSLVRDKYRKFKLGKFDGNDDTAYMKEALTRRLQRFKDGDEKFTPLPDLIVCDGGLGQIHAVEQIVSEFGYNIKVIGFKKDKKHKTKSIVFSDGKELPLNINPCLLYTSLGGGSVAIKNSEIAERLKGIRLLSDVSVAEMASQLNISESEYLAFENGDVQITVSILLDACEYLKISMTELLTGEPADVYKIQALYF